MTSDELKKLGLGDLAFKAEDFRELLTRLCAHPEHQAATIAEVANRILAEKLTPLLTELHELRKLKEEVERAPEVFGLFPANVFTPTRTKTCTHKARLVCIKPIKE